MRTILFCAAAALALSFGPAFADETVVHHDDAVVAPSDSTTVEKHETVGGCASKTVHKEDDAGDSKTVHKSDCD